MIIEFSVRNYKAIRDEQTFSFVPTALTELSETNTFESGVPGVGRLIRTAGIYGANAAGKTTLLDALLRMKSLVLSSANDSASDHPIGIKPFLFDASKDEPTMMQVVFVHHEVRYQYGFECTRERIIEEWLYAYPDRRAQHVFSRTYKPELGDYEWDIKPFLKGRKSAWRDSTGPRSLFLSVAARNNSKQLAEVRTWFRDSIIESSGDNLSRTAKMIVETGEGVKAILLGFLKKADLRIEDLRFEERRLNDGDAVFVAIRDALPEPARKSFDEAISYRISTKHIGKDGDEIWLDMSEESQGTREYFSQLGFLMVTLSIGGLMVFDELNRNLHPLLAQALVSFFHSDDWNPKHAQLWFTTHETSLLTTDLLRRDQVWFAEKNEDGATSIYPMTDFEPRKGASIEKHYLQGRFGAIPYISDDRFATTALLSPEQTDG